jgi:hypothetical protein
MDTDAHKNLVELSLSFVTFSKLVLRLDGCLDCIDGTSEIDEVRIPDVLHQRSVMPANRLVHNFVMLPYELHSETFLCTHPFGKILDVGEHYSGKFTLLWQIRGWSNQLLM